jgi:hypothetical protein
MDSSLRNIVSSDSMLNVIIDKASLNGQPMLMVMMSVEQEELADIS